MLLSEILIDLSSDPVSVERRLTSYGRLIASNFTFTDHRRPARAGRAAVIGKCDGLGWAT